MTDTPTLSSRLREGQGADRELDTYIWCHFNNRTIVGRSKPDDYYPNLLLCRNNNPPHDECVAPIEHLGEHNYPPRYTSDLNAVFALVERELPGWGASCDATLPTSGIDWQLEPPAGVQATQSFKGVYFAESSMNIAAHCRSIILALLAATHKE